MSSQKNHFLQKGKGLVGFLAGLVLATMIIIAVLLMLNSNSKRDFRNDPALGGGASGAVAQQTPASDALPEQGSEAVAVQQPNLPAETAPAQTAQTTPADNAANSGAAVAESKPAVPAAETVPAVSAETAAAAAGALAGAKAAQQSADNSSNLSQPQRKPVPVSPPPVAVAPKPVRPQAANTAPAARPKPKAEVRGTSVFRPHENNTARYRPAPTPRPERNLANNRPKPAAPKAVEPIKPAPKPAAVAKQQPAKDPKPTPQMILETGNIDKAREAAKRQANAKPAPKAAAAAKPESKPKAQASKGGTVVFQTGSFASARAADAQRARLAMMGVQTKISEAKIDGKSVYRVQTAPMSGERAGNTRNTLNKNGVNVYERSGQ
ncbi:SPOR domain-containing protein [Conchiformibius steedae]|uniref:SPOR domain-containing protein n=1 Tax=Conchiformibius steedae TaxID=153493 RepID=A0A3P2A868_9NEIS|nr:SPOR domain-containing protein [Conchiformibius steedae]RRD91175.1 hypothetical protein EII21_01925 [Conchiformibius steedae]